MNYAVIVAAGKSERMGPNVDKAFLSLGTKPVLAYSLLAYEKCQDIDGIVLVVRKDRLEAAYGLTQMFGYSKVKKIVAGGTRRQDSVANGLQQLNDEVRIVSVHDGARPCVTPAIISESIKAAKRYGSGVAAGKITDTVKVVENNVSITKTLDRSNLWTVQTPQTFKVELLRKALGVVARKRVVVTDESAAVELLGEKVRIVPVVQPNVKITTPDDLVLAATLLRL